VGQGWSTLLSPCLCDNQSDELTPPVSFPPDEMQGSKTCVAVLLLLSAGCSLAGAEKFTDVPLGECHMCEVTCFNDCVGKYDAEIIQADRREYEAKQRMLRAHGGGHLSARGLAGVSLDDLVQISATEADAKNRTNHVFAWRHKNPQTPSLGLEIEKAEKFAGCLRRKKCRGHNLKQTPRIPTGDCTEFSGPKSKSLLALRGQLQDKTGCSTSDNSACTMECFEESVDQGTSHEATGEVEIPKTSSVVTGRALLQKRDYPTRPIRIGSFSKVGMSLDFCFKSCLAVTCGCLGAPGFDTIDALYNQIKKNENSGEQIIDTKAEFHYKPAATEGDCGGVKKGTSDLYVQTSDSGAGDNGWVEICTPEMISALFGPTYDKGKETLTRCKSGAVPDNMFGCTWSKTENKCVVGFYPVALECNKQYTSDPTF